MECKAKENKIVFISFINSIQIPYIKFIKRNVIKRVLFDKIY